MLEKLAKNILIKSNWISDYYYIVKVMQSCSNKDSNLNPMLRYVSLQRSYWWGDKQLKNKKNNLISKYPFLENQIEEICREYEKSLWTEMYLVDNNIDIIYAEEIDNKE